MSPFTATAMGKFAGSAAVVASIATGGAAVGALPDTLQAQAADVAEIANVELPRPGVRVDTDGAIEVIVDIVDGAPHAFDIDAEGGGEAKVEGETSTEQNLESSEVDAGAEVDLGIQIGVAR